jgi:hypothetical protein
VGNLTKQYYLKVRSPNGQKTHEKMFTTLAVKEVKVKTTLRFHISLVRITSIKNTSNNKCWQGWGEEGTLMQYWWDCKIVQPLWKTT